MQNFDVYFLGETLPDVDPVTVRQGVAKLFKVQESAVERLFTGKPLRVKQGLDAETASRYRAAFREVGALIQIVPEGAPPPAPTTAPAPQAIEAEEIVLDASDVPAEADSGPAAGDFGLAEPGATLDHTPPTPPADIDTSALEALPPNSGSLEDCKVEKPRRPIPDISHLHIVDD